MKKYGDFTGLCIYEISSLAISAVSDPSATVSTVATVSFSTKANVGSSSSKVSLIELSMSA